MKTKKESVDDTQRYNIKGSKANLLSRQNLKNQGVTLSKVPPKDKANPFPLEVFPESVQNMITSLHETMNFPIDYSAAGALFAASVAIGNSHKLNVKGDWNEPCILFMVLVGNAGVTKSHPLRWFIKPMKLHDDKTFLEYKKEMDIFLENEKRPAKEREPMAKPILKKLLATDTTPESLVKYHEMNPRGYSIYMDEIAGFFKGFNKYNAAGGEEQMYLSLWNGGHVDVTRKTSDPMRVDNTFVSICGTIQPLALEAIAKKGNDVNGFVDRWLAVIPHGLKKEYHNDKKVPDGLAEDWRNLVERILKQPYTNGSNIITYSADAKKGYKKWQRDNTDAVNQANLDGQKKLAGVYTKLENYINRFALIIEIINALERQEQPYQISVSSIEKAIKLVEYFREMNTRMHDILHNDMPLDKLPKKWQDYYNSLPDDFTTAMAKEAAERQKIHSRSVDRFLAKNKELIQKIEKGIYKKLA